MAGKKRKTRCQYAPGVSDVCITCDRRGTLCLSQEFPENSTTGKKGRGTHRNVDERLRRTETLVEHLLGRTRLNSTDSHSNDSCTSLQSPIFDCLPASPHTMNFSNNDDLSMPLFEREVDQTFAVTEAYFLLIVSRTHTGIIFRSQLALLLLRRAVPTSVTLRKSGLASQGSFMQSFRASKTQVP